MRQSSNAIEYSIQLMPSSGGLGGVVGGGCHKPRPGLGLVGGWVGGWVGGNPDPRHLSQC